MPRENNSYDRSVRSLNDSDSYNFTGESEFSRERAEPYEMIDYLIDHETQYKGVGPKNFILTDERILEKVSEVLTRDSHIDASEIEVLVQNGVVYLKGYVQSRRMKHLTELCVENLPGVQDVFNFLRFEL